MKLSFTAVGDFLIQRHIPHYAGFDEIRDWISSADARYFNLETTVNEPNTCYGSQYCGGSYLRVSPDHLPDCQQYGFNMVSLCNNHSMDYSYEGLLQTLEFVGQSGLVHAGIGTNLDEAAAPAYLDTENGRVALIGCTTTPSNVAAMAGKQSRRVPGRPGLNVIRWWQQFIVTPEQMKVLKQIAEDTGINWEADIYRGEGYVDPLPEGRFRLGSLELKEGEVTGKKSMCYTSDLARMEKSIYEAKLQADQIIVAVHSHEIKGPTKEDHFDALEELARFCIDKGADAVIGHGPHLLRPMEIYKGKPIFYSLGDFVLQNENIQYFPEDYYTGKGLTSDATTHEVFKLRSANFTRGLQTNIKMFQTVIPRWEVEDGVMTKLELKAVQLGFDLPRSRNGLPAPAKDNAILERFAEMCKPYGVEMDIADGVATVKL